MENHHLWWIFPLNNQMVIMESFNHLPQFVEHHDHDSQGEFRATILAKRGLDLRWKLCTLVQKMAGKPKIP